MTEHEIDLRTVGAVLIQGRQYSVSPGSLRIVRPVFTMANDEGTGEVTCYGGHMPPPTMVFTTRDGMPVSGSYDHGVLFLHKKPEPEPAEPVKQEPTGPRIYVQNLRGKQGHIVDTGKMNSDGGTDLRVQWYTPGSNPVWVSTELLTIIAATDVVRCPNGQTGDKCGSGENQCEPCLADEDTEAEGIERSMNA